MNCEEVKISLHDFVDELSDDFMKREIEVHLRSCNRCFQEYKRLIIFFDRLKELPYTVDPPKEIIELLSTELLKRSMDEKAREAALHLSNIRKIKKEQAAQEKKFKQTRGAVRKSLVSRTIMIPGISRAYPASPKFDLTKTILTLLPLVLIAVGYFIYDFQKFNSPWKVKSIEGKITINGVLNHLGKISQGESLFTNEESKAIIHVPKVGIVEVNENSLVVLEKAKDGDNRITLQHGTIRVANTSDMPDFAVELKNCFVSDRGGEFIVSVDDTAGAKIFVNFGFVEIHSNGEDLFLSEGYNCEIRNGFRIGTPYRVDALDSLKEEVKNFDYKNGGDDSIAKIISYARESDMLTLLALIPHASQLQRQVLFQKITNRFPPPEGVTRMGIIRAEKEMLYLWWQEIEWQL